MGYEILIGEWDTAAKAEEEGCAPRTVQALELADAPAFDGDEMTGHTNRRQPSYGAWAEFCRATGLGGVFHGVNGLFAEHPGTVRLTGRHARTIRNALRAYRAACPGASPTFLSGSATDHHLARLEWLAWWVDWALANCKVPAIHNR